MILRRVAFAAPLGFDTLAIAIVLGLRGFAPWRPALVFAVFEMAMPLVGIAAGRLAGDHFAVAAQAVGGVVLLAVAVHALREAFDDDDESEGLAFSSLRAAIAAGLAISLDELAVGFPMGAVGVPVVPILAIIGVQTLLVTVGGIAIGRRVGDAFGRRAARFAGIAAGVVFGTVGVSLLVEALHR
ncbi:MAG: hypothetical protein NVS3B16_24920 [Vulcanimicrobiaceae bacterium]